MKIRLTPPQPDSPSFEIDHQISVALAAVHAASIGVRGAGRFGDDVATILLQKDMDCPRALGVLRNHGIHGRWKPEGEICRTGDGARMTSVGERKSDTRIRTFLPRIDVQSFFRTTQSLRLF